MAYLQSPSPPSSAASARKAFLQNSLGYRRAHTAPGPVPLALSSPPDTKTPITADKPIIPSQYVPESAAPSTVRYSSDELKRLFGCRKLNYEVLPHLGTGLHVTTDSAPPPSIGDFVTIKQGKHGSTVPRPKNALHTVGADIGHGDGTSPGGYRYCLMLVDLSTPYAWCYGLPDLTGPSLEDAFWRFFVDAGG